MKKAHATAIVVVSLALLTALPAEAGGRRYYYGGNNGGVNGWAAAAIGAVVGVAVGAALTQQPSANYYVQPAPVYQANPNVYYAPQQACQTAQVPVYNQYGQIIQYRQVCAN